MYTFPDFTVHVAVIFYQLIYIAFLMEFFSKLFYMDAHVLEVEKEVVEIIIINISNTVSSSSLDVRYIAVEVYLGV